MARDWDTRVVFVHRAGRWWWNAWRESTGTELYGFTDSCEEAWQALHAAITSTGQPTDPTTWRRSDSGPPIEA